MANNLIAALRRDKGGSLLFAPVGDGHANLCPGLT
jgi:hypothetical protein